VFFRGVSQFLWADGGTVVRLFACTSADPTGRIYLKFDTGKFMKYVWKLQIFKNRIGMSDILLKDQSFFVAWDINSP